MSRAATGKTSRLVIFIRFQIFFMLLYVPLGWLLDVSAFRIEASRWSSHLLFAAIWFGSGSVFHACMTVWMRWSFNLMFGNRQAYWNWLTNGGDPYSDWLPWPLNLDTKVVRMAIGTPPPFSLCPVCGGQLGRYFGNQCGDCGLYWDNCSN